MQYNLNKASSSLVGRGSDAETISVTGKRQFNAKKLLVSNEGMKSFVSTVMDRSIELLASHEK